MAARKSQMTPFSAAMLLSAGKIQRFHDKILKAGRCGCVSV